MWILLRISMRYFWKKACDAIQLPSLIGEYEACFAQNLTTKVDNASLLTKKTMTNTRLAQRICK